MYDLQELRDELAESGPAGSYFETLVWDDTVIDGQYANPTCTFVCNQCGEELESGDGGLKPCPTHAPTDVPGLYKIECPKGVHSLWTVAGDQNSYGAPCLACEWGRAIAERARAERRDGCYHWPWRRWRITRWITTQFYVWGLTSTGGGYSIGGATDTRPGHDGCVDPLPFGWSPRRRRVYIARIPVDTWRCWLKGRHRRGEDLHMFGFCTRCIPWPCCGSDREDHNPGCPDTYPAVTS